MNTIDGPLFQVESDKAMIILGNSERDEVGDFLARTLDERGIFEDIDVYTLNHSAALLGRASIQKAMETRTVITHSAGIMRVPKALQIVAINPPEPVPLGQLVKRAMDVANDPIVPEVGAHQTGFMDMLKAGLEMARSPIVSARTSLAIAGGYSSTERLIDGAEDFRAGRAMVHSQFDTFGFADLADTARAANAGVTAVTLGDHYHNEVLFAPNRTIDALTPDIFPEFRIRLSDND